MVMPNSRYTPPKTMGQKTTARQTYMAQKRSAMARGQMGSAPRTVMQNPGYGIGQPVRSRGLMERFRGGMSSAREGIGNASRRAYIGGTSAMNRAEAGARGVMGRFGGRGSVTSSSSMSGLPGSMSSTTTSARGLSRPAATGRVHSRPRPVMSATTTSSRGLNRPVSTGMTSGMNRPVMYGPTRADMPMMYGPTRADMPGVMHGPGRAEYIRSNVNASRAARGGASAKQVAKSRFQTTAAVKAIEGEALPKAVEGGKIGMLKQLSDHVGNNKRAYAIGAGVIGLGALIGSRRNRGTSSGSQGAYR